MKRLITVAFVIAAAASAYAQQRPEGRTERSGTEDRMQQREGRMRERMARGHKPGDADEQPGGPLMHALTNPRALERLGISEEQASELRSRMETLHSQIEVLNTRRQELARQQVELLKQPETTKNDILVVVDQLADVQKQVAKLRIEQLFAVRDVVGAEKMAEFRTRMGPRPEGDRGPRHGNRRPTRSHSEDNDPPPPPPPEDIPGAEF